MEGKSTSSPAADWTSATSYIKSLPASIGALYVLSVLLIMRWTPGLKSIFFLARSSFIEYFHIDRDVDRCVLDAAGAALKVRQLEELEIALSKLASAEGYRTPELLAEHAGARNRLAHRLLYQSRGATRTKGVATAISQLLASIGIDWVYTGSRQVTLLWTHLMSAITLYCAIGAGYALFICFLDDAASAIGEKYAVLIEWPHLSNWTGNARQIAQYSLSFTIPILLGQTMLSRRREASIQGETEFQGEAVVYTRVFLVSAVLGLIYYAIYISGVSLQEIFLTSGELSYQTPKLWVDVFATAVSATFVLRFMPSATTAFRQLGHFTLVSLFAGLLFGLSALLFEWADVKTSPVVALTGSITPIRTASAQAVPGVSEMHDAHQLTAPSNSANLSQREAKWRGTYWQQSTLGLALMFAYCFSFIKMGIVKRISVPAPAIIPSDEESDDKEDEPLGEEALFDLRQAVTSGSTSPISLGGG